MQPMSSPNVYMLAALTVTPFPKGIVSLKAQAYTGLQYVKAVFKKQNKNM